jgi:hypothetical protein
MEKGARHTRLHLCNASYTLLERQKERTDDIDSPKGYRRGMKFGGMEMSYLLVVGVFM